MNSAANMGTQHKYTDEVAQLKAKVEKLRGDSDMLDWLQGSFFSEDNIDWVTSKVSVTTSKWAFFAPRGVQGDIREVLKAARAAQRKLS